MRTGSIIQLLLFGKYSVIFAAFLCHGGRTSNRWSFCPFRQSATVPVHGLHSTAYSTPGSRGTCEVGKCIQIFNRRLKISNCLTTPVPRERRWEPWNVREENLLSHGHRPGQRRRKDCQGSEGRGTVWQQHHTLFIRCKRSILEKQYNIYRFLHSNRMVDWAGPAQGCVEVGKEGLVAAITLWGERRTPSGREGQESLLSYTPHWLKTGKTFTRGKNSNLFSANC